VKITAVPICTENRAPFDALCVRPDQDHLIAPNEAWLDQVLPIEKSHSFGLMNADTPMGLFTMTDTRTVPADVVAKYFQPGCAYLWHFMVDAAAQGRGLGRAALSVIEEHAKAFDGIGMSLTTADLEPGNALPFYSAAGYAPSGRRLHGEIELIKQFQKVRNA
tara:strand:+ start:267 stop:755 length:489 start_codon:yes stop_codon:yes gene_type:complete